MPTPDHWPVFLHNIIVLLNSFQRLIMRKFKSLTVFLAIIITHVNVHSQGVQAKVIDSIKAELVNLQLKYMRICLSFKSAL